MVTDLFVAKMLITVYWENSNSQLQSHVIALNLNNKNFN